MQNEARFISNSDQLAEILLGMTFRDLIGVCVTLVDMIDDNDVSVRTPSGLASVLSNWAESKLEPED
jgi:hypothetical protein